MKCFRWGCVILFFVVATGKSKAQMVFSSIDSLFSYASFKSIALQMGKIELEQAKKAKLAALIGIPDVTGNASLSYTHNTKLPVNLFPAEVFGGQPGTYREVQSGVPFVTYANENLDIKLFNPKSWENIRLYKLNILNNVATNKVTLKTLLESISATYYNIVGLQTQLLTSGQNIESATVLLKVTQYKYETGLVSLQNVNDAKVNLLTTQESYNQIQYLISQQYLALKIICDIPDSEVVEIDQLIADPDSMQKPAVLVSNISFSSSFLKERIALSTYKQQERSLYPTVSFFQAYTTQQFNTQNKVFDNSVNWVPSSYVGLRVIIPIPSSYTLTQVSKAKYDYLLARKKTEQDKIKAELEAKQLTVDYGKALSQAKSNKEIYLLRKETYEKNMTLYSEGVASLENTLNSFNAMISSHYSLISSRVSVLAVKTRIDINKSIK